MDELKRVLQPDRIIFAKQEIEKKGYSVLQVSKAELNFYFKQNKIKVFPFTGWFTGKGITDGRGIKNLLKQI